MSFDMDDDGRDKKGGNRRSSKKFGRRKNLTLKYVDYKDVDFLRKFTTSQGKIIPRKRSGYDLQSHHKITQAIKRARFLSLMPFTV